MFYSYKVEDISVRQIYCSFILIVFMGVDNVILCHVSPIFRNNAC